MMTGRLAQAGQPGHPPRRIQRSCACGARAPKGGECEDCRGKKVLQRHVDTGEGGARSDAVPSRSARNGVDAVLARPGVALDGATRQLMEGRFGHDFSQVRVHAGSDAAASAQALGAQAYATGRHLVFGAGRFAPRTRHGLWLLAHELAHTVQQRLGGDAAQAKADAAAPEHDVSEAAADRAADAVLSGMPLPRLGAASGGLHLYSITKVDKVADDEKLVHLDNGLRYRVHRGSEFVIRERLHNWADLNPGADKERVWLELEWCAGKDHGSVRMSADVPKQVAQAVVAAVTKGSDIKDILRDARITPRVDVKLLQSGDFSLSANGEVSLDLDGKPTHFSGGATLSKGAFDFGVKVEPGKGPDGKDQGVQGTGTITYTPGRKDKKEDCRRNKRSVVEVPNFHCETERDTPAHDVPIQTPVTDRESRYIYFDYARDSIDTGRSGTEIATLAKNLAEGFKVTNVAGFTSPEGPMEAKGKFMGNVALAQRRAEAAARQVQAACPKAADVAGGGAGGQAPASLTSGDCFVSGAQAAGAADPELYTRVVVDDEGKVTEVEGTPLAEAAVGDFLASPAEERHRTPALTEAVARQRSPAGQARLVYPLLRRAVVSLVRERMMAGKKHVDASTRTESASCPQDVIDAAFGSGGKAAP